MPEVKEERT